MPESNDKAAVIEKMTPSEEFKADMESQQRRENFVNSLVFLVLVMIFTLAFIVFLIFDDQVQVPDAAVQYEIVLAEDQLCVGDPLRFDSVVYIQEDVVVRFVASIVHITDDPAYAAGRTVQEVSTGLKATVRRKGEVLRTSGRVIELEDFAPGRYEYRLGAETSGRESGFIFLPFEVLDCGT